MRHIDSYVTADYQTYLELVEKTNHQLSLWYNPYGLMVGVLTLIVAILAIVATFVVAWIFRDRNKAKKERDEYFRALEKRQQEHEENLISSTNLYKEKLFERVDDYKEELKNASESRRTVIRSEIESLERLAGELKDQLQVAKKISSVPEASVDFAKGNVIKAQSLDFLYWYSTDGNRYSFPTEDVFHSWFPVSDFRPITLVLSDYQLAAIPLAGNITYKAGTRLIKIGSDPKFYAVSPGGKVRWIETEGLARRLYGEDWKNLLVTVPEVLFLDYQIDIAVKDLTTYSRHKEMSEDKLP